MSVDYLRFLGGALAGASDSAPLGRAAAVVRNRGDVLDRADLEAGRLQAPDSGLTAGAGTLDEHVDLAHPVLHRLAGRVLGGHLRGERRGLAGAFEPDVAGAGPGDDGAVRVADRHDRVVEGALDVRVAVRDVLLLLAPHLLATGAGSLLRRHELSSRLLLAGLLLAGDRAARSLAGAGVGVGALAVHREATTMPDALVGADLDLAPDVLGDLAAEVTLDPVVAVDPVAKPRDLFVGQVAHPGVRADAGLGQRLARAGPADAVDVGQRDLTPLLAGEVDAGEACHERTVSSCSGGRCPHRPRLSWAAFRPTGPRPPTGGSPGLRTRSGVRLVVLVLL